MGGFHTSTLLEYRRNSYQSKSAKTLTKIISQYSFLKVLTAHVHCTVQSVLRQLNLERARVVTLLLFFEQAVEGYRAFL